MGVKRHGERSGESGAEAGAVAGAKDGSGGSWDEAVVGASCEADEGPAMTAGGAGEEDAARAGDVVTALPMAASSESSAIGVHRSASFAGVVGDGGEGGGTAEKAEVPTK